MEADGLTLIVLIVTGPSDARGLVCNDVEAWAGVSWDEWVETGARVAVHYVEPDPQEAP